MKLFLYHINMNKNEFNNINKWDNCVCKKTNHKMISLIKKIQHQHNNLFRLNNPNKHKKLIIDFIEIYQDPKEDVDVVEKLII